MRAFIVAVIAAVAIPCAAQDVYVNGYTKQDGTYVQPYHRTSPNGTTRDNYSHQGNYNPYTGRYGTKND